MLGWAFPFYTPKLPPPPHLLVTVFTNHYEVSPLVSDGGRGSGAAVPPGGLFAKWLCSLNVPIKGSEVAILLDNPFLCEHCMNPGVFPLVVSISLTLLFCLSPSSNQSYYTLTVRVFNTLHFPNVSEVPLQSKLWLVYVVGSRGDRDI